MKIHHATLIILIALVLSIDDSFNLHLDEAFLIMCFCIGLFWRRRDSGKRKFKKY